MLISALNQFGVTFYTDIDIQSVLILLNFLKTVRITIKRLYNALFKLE